MNVQIYVRSTLYYIEVKKKKVSSFNVLIEGIMKKIFFCHVAPQARKEALIWIPARRERDISLRISDRIQSMFGNVLENFSFSQGKRVAISKLDKYHKVRHPRCVQ